MLASIGTINAQLNSFVSLVDDEDHDYDECNDNDADVDGDSPLVTLKLPVKCPDAPRR